MSWNHVFNEKRRYFWKTSLPRNTQIPFYRYYKLSFSKSIPKLLLFHGVEHMLQTKIRRKCSLSDHLQIRLKLDSICLLVLGMDLMYQTLVLAHLIPLTSSSFFNQPTPLPIYISAPFSSTPFMSSWYWNYKVQFVSHYENFSLW